MHLGRHQSTAAAFVPRPSGKGSPFGHSGPLWRREGAHGWLCETAILITLQRLTARHLGRHLFLSPRSEGLQLADQQLIGERFALLWCQSTWCVGPRRTV